MSGADLCRALRSNWVLVPIIVLTGDIREETEVEALAAGANDVAHKTRFASFVARLRALLASGAIQIGGLELRPTARSEGSLGPMWSRDRQRTRRGLSLGHDLSSACRSTEPPVSVRAPRAATYADLQELPPEVTWQTPTLLRGPPASSSGRSSVVEAGRVGWHFLFEPELHLDADIVRSRPGRLVARAGARAAERSADS
jgi:hypothetical protein